MKPSLVLPAALLLALVSSRLPAQGLPPHPVKPATSATPSLKRYMASFGTMLASLEILQVKEKQIDWEAIDIAVQEMSQSLAAMQGADREKNYKEYTDILAAGMVDLRGKSQRKDKSFFESVDKVAKACFQCHAAHRPPDYLTPKEKGNSAKSEK